MQRSTSTNHTKIRLVREQDVAAGHIPSDTEFIIGRPASRQIHRLRQHIQTAGDTSRTDIGRHFRLPYPRQPTNFINVNSSVGLSDQEIINEITQVERLILEIQIHQNRIEELRSAQIHHLVQLHQVAQHRENSYWTNIAASRQHPDYPNHQLRHQQDDDDDHHRHPQRCHQQQDQQQRNDRQQQIIHGLHTIIDQQVAQHALLDQRTERLEQQQREQQQQQQQEQRVPHHHQRRDPVHTPLSTPPSSRAYSAPPATPNVSYPLPTQARGVIRSRSPTRPSLPRANSSYRTPYGKHRIFRSYGTPYDKHPRRCPSSSPTRTQPKLPTYSVTFTTAEDTELSDKETTPDLPRRRQVHSSLASSSSHSTVINTAAQQANSRSSGEDSPERSSPPVGNSQLLPDPELINTIADNHPPVTVAGNRPPFNPPAYDPRSPEYQPDSPTENRDPNVTSSLSPSIRPFTLQPPALPIPLQPSHRNLQQTVLPFVPINNNQRIPDHDVGTDQANPIDLRTSTGTPTTTTTTDRINFLNRLTALGYDHPEPVSDPLEGAP